jgi:hypothetical protein
MLPRTLSLLVLMMLLQACPPPNGTGTGGGTGSGGGTASGGGTGSGTGAGGGTGSGGGTGAFPEPPAELLPGQRQTWNGYSFIAPPNVTASVDATDAGVSLVTPAISGKGPCFMLIAPLQPAEADADAQALSLLRDSFSTNYKDVAGPSGYASPMDLRQHGVSGAGWEYVEMSGELIALDGTNSHNVGRILLARLGTEVGVVIGYESWDNRCLDDINGTKLTWQRLFYSLQFPSFKGGDTEALGRQLIGKWRISDGTIFIGETYAANGRYGTSATFQTYKDISPTEILQTTTTYFGDGVFASKGAQLWKRSDKGVNESVHFRIVREPNSAVSTGWLPNLYQLELNSSGSPYESILRREVN